MTSIIGGEMGQDFYAAPTLFTSPEFQGAQDPLYQDPMYGYRYISGGPVERPVTGCRNLWLILSMFFLLGLIAGIVSLTRKTQPLRGELYSQRSRILFFVLYIALNAIYIWVGYTSCAKGNKTLSWIMFGLLLITFILYLYYVISIYYAKIRI